MTKYIEKESSRITGGLFLLKNTLWNTFGLLLPLVIGFFSMPFLVHGLGVERFGVLTLAWVVIGYFSIFDFGLGRALTKIVAEKIGQDNQEEIPVLFWTTIMLMLCAGIIVTALVAFLSENLVTSWLNIEYSLQDESLSAFYILAISIPFVIATTAFRGLLEAYQMFATVNIIRIPLGLLTFLGPLFVLPFSTSLDDIVIVLLVGRIIGVCAYYYYCIQAVPEINKNISVDKRKILPLIGFGGWIAVSNIIGPLMVYLDRFLIGAVVTMTAVAYYVAPYEMVTKLIMIPMGLIGVLFPAFSTLLSSNRNKAARHYVRALNLIYFSMLPIFLVINAIAYEGIELWLDNEFAMNSTIVLQILAVGVFLNSIAHIPFVLIQGAGRPDIPAKIYFMELPLYLIFLWYAMEHYGIAGAAGVWSLRIFFDTILFIYLAGVIVPEVKGLFIKYTIMLIVATVLLLSMSYIELINHRLLLLIIALPIIVIFAWKWGIDMADKNQLLTLILNKQKI